MRSTTYWAAWPLLLFLATIALAPSCSGDTVLRQEAERRYDEYIRDTEARIDREVRSPDYLWSARSPGRWERIRAGEVAVEPWRGNGDSEIGDAIIHDWIGAVFARGADLTRVVGFLQDYNIHKDYYRPEVIESRLLSRSGNDYQLYYRIVKKKFVTVVLNTNHTANFYPLSSTRLYSRSFTTRIAELRDSGKPTEHEAPPGHDHGYLWRLNTYWRLEEKDGGVYLECQSISLTTTPPFGLGWLVNPIVRALPPESLTHLLSATRDAVNSRH